MYPITRITPLFFLHDGTNVQPIFFPSIYPCPLLSAPFKYETHDIPSPPPSLKADGVQDDAAVEDDERQEDDEDDDVARAQHLEDAVRRDLPLEPPGQCGYTSGRVNQSSPSSLGATNHNPGFVHSLQQPFQPCRAYLTWKSASSRFSPMRAVSAATVLTCSPCCSTLSRAACATCAESMHAQDRWREQIHPS